MKHSFTLLFCLMLLASVLACKHSMVSTAPDIITSQNPYQGCRIAQKVLKGTTAQASESTGLVTLNGYSYYLKNNRTYRYTYDLQGRLAEEQVEDQTGVLDLPRTIYIYSPTSLESKLYYRNTSTLWTATLNATGYVVVDKDKTYTYNADGYLIQEKAQLYTATYEYKDGNLIKAETLLPVTFEGKTLYNSIKITYQYDLARPNLPATQSFYGKASRNLLIQSEEVKVYIGGTEGPKVSKYQYLFDNKGRVTRRFEIWHTNLVEVIDYTYTCN